MHKTITYSSFIVVTILVITIFLTAKTYTQLGVAVLLYPALAYFALKVFPRKKYKSPVITIEMPTTKPTDIKMPSIDIADKDKRAFLKLVGAAGLSFFLFSLFSKRSGVPFLGKLSGPETTSLSDHEGKKVDPAQRQPMDGYQISEIDDNIISYYGFINKDGAWVVMREDTDNSTFRYTKGEIDFPSNWSNREQLKYDYFHNVF